MGTSSIGYGFQTTFGSPFQLFSDFTKSCLKITPYTTGTQCLKLFKFISQWISGFRSNGSIVRALRNRQTDRWMDVRAIPVKYLMRGGSGSPKISKNYLNTILNSINKQLYP